MFYYISRISLVIILAITAALLHKGILNNTLYAPKVTESRHLHQQDNFETATVSRIIDGDTIELSNGMRLRYIGIDTPEMNFTNNRSPECFAKEATKLNKELVLAKTVRLVKDINNTDRYGRLLRYVYINDDSSTIDPNKSINEYLVEAGVAVARSFPPDVAMQDVFRKAEAKARAEGRGLWAKNACTKK